MKEYLPKNHFKGFIIFFQVFYSSLVMFAFKTNENLRFCIDYPKLNVIIKRNKYRFSLIEEVIGKIIDYKHFTKLNVISAFNKI